MSDAAECHGCRRPALSRRKNNQTAASPRAAVLPHLGVAIRSHALLLALGLATVALKSTIFAPLGFWPLAYVCLVPWVIGVGTAAAAPRVYVHAYLMATVFFLINVRWLAEPAGPYYAPLALYLAIYFPMMACPLRHAVRRRRMPLAIVLPIIWVGGEWLRAVVISGFPWFFLSHSHYRVTPMLQVADTLGAYGLSFVIASVNGAIADVILARLSARRATEPIVNRRQARIGAGFAAGCVVLTLLYGAFRLNQSTISDGPRVAVIQGDYTDTIDGSSGKPKEKRARYMAWLEEASEFKPDLYLLPESAWPACLNVEYRTLTPQGMQQLRWMKESFYSVNQFLQHQHWSQSTFDLLAEFAQRTNGYVVMGAGSYFPRPYDLRCDVITHNSAFLFSPQGGEPARYDKRHLVYFGEIVPFRFGRLRQLYFWLNSIVPYSGPSNWEFSLFPGESFHSMRMQAASQDGKVYRFGIPICYEDVMPYIARAFTAGADGRKQVDFLLNISNDGWFGHGGQQAQHLAICTMRAVENRVGIARSVNTGISGFIDPDGRLHDLIGADRPAGTGHGSGISVATLKVDSRFTLYSRYGDWFAWICAALWLAFYLDYVIVRAIASRREAATVAAAAAEGSEGIRE